MSIDWGIIIPIASTLISSGVAVWSIWYFLAIPKLKYKVEILPYMVPRSENYDIISKLKIIYDGKIVNKLSFMSITIYNKGKGIADNFTTPIKIRCNAPIIEAYPDKETLECKIIKEYHISESGNEIEFIPEYINQHEMITFYAIVDGAYDINIEVLGRCKGCSKINSMITIHWKTLEKYIRWLLIIAFIILIITGSHILKNKVLKLEENLQNINNEISSRISEVQNLKSKFTKVQKSKNGDL